MTFKHLKFNESSTMQEFEKLAAKKGLVKQEIVKKTASKSLDLAPSQNLIVNILKLSSGLRQAGFDKHADELETKYLQYKVATSLYETSKETGEDLVDMAHPKGSHKLEGVDGDAVVETIVDQKKKIQDVVNKKPTGKLSKASDIISAVKIALADVPAQKSKEQLNEEIALNVDAAKQLWNKINSVIDDQGGFSYIFGRGIDYASMSFKINSLFNKPASLSSLKSLKEYFNAIADVVKPGISLKSLNPFGGMEDSWKQLSEGFAKINKYMDVAIYCAKQLNAQTISGDSAPMPESAKLEPTPSKLDFTGVYKRIESAKNKLKSMESKLATENLTEEERNSSKKWIDAKNKAYDSIKANFDKSASPENYELTLERLNSFDAAVSAFEKEWL